MRRHRLPRLTPLLTALAVLTVGACAPDGDPARQAAGADSTFDDEMSDDEMSDDEMSDDEMSDDEMSDDEMSDDEMSDEEMSDDDAAVESIPTTTTADDGAATTEPPASATTAPDTSAPAADTTTPDRDGSATTTVPPAPTATTPAPTTTTPPAATTPSTTTPPAPPPDPGATAATALAGLNSIIADVDLSVGTAGLSICAADPTGSVFQAVFSSAATGVYAEPFAATTTALIVDLGEEYGAELSCERFDEDTENGLGLRIVGAPDDLVAFSEFFANPEGLAEIAVTVTPSGSADGGDLFHVCSDDGDEPIFSYCEVDWISSGLMVTAWAAGTESDSVDLDTVQTALAARLPQILTDLTNAG